jgi:hypothetical protein
MLLLLLLLLLPVAVAAAVLPLQPLQQLREESHPYPLQQQESAGRRFHGGH